MKSVCRKSAGFLLAVSLSLLAGCASVSPEDYASQRPSLDMLRFLAGHTTAWGLAQSRSGEVVRRFRIEMDGVAVDGDTVKVQEHDFYTDGKVEAHQWVFRRTGAHAITATSDQVVGEARGAQYGNALNLTYTLKVQMPDGVEREFAIDDWFYLQDDCHLMNRTYASKFGFHAFDVLTFFQKPDCAGSLPR